MSFELDEAIDLLKRTPGICRSWMRDLPAAWTDAREGPESFSPRDVIAHMVQGEEEDWLARARIILEHGAQRPFEAFDRYGFRDLYEGQSTEELLDRLEELRSRNLLALRSMNLTEEDLAQPGQHPELGAVNLRQLLASWVVHDLAHLGQVARVMAKRYASDVGPWAEYLPVLAR